MKGHVLFITASRDKYKSDVKCIVRDEFNTYNTYIVSASNILLNIILFNIISILLYIVI